MLNTWKKANFAFDIVDHFMPDAWKAQKPWRIQQKRQSPSVRPSVCLLLLLLLLDAPAFCKISSRLAGLWQMIIRMGWPFANYRLDFFLSTRFFSILLIIFSKFLISSEEHHLRLQTFLLQILGSGFNLADLSRTMCSCLLDYLIRRISYLSLF